MNAHFLRLRPTLIKAHALMEESVRILLRDGLLTGDKQVKRSGSWFQSRLFLSSRCCGASPEGHAGVQVLVLRVTAVQAVSELFAVGPAAAFPPPQVTVRQPVQDQKLHHTSECLTCFSSLITGNLVKKAAFECASL